MSTENTPTESRPGDTLAAALGLGLLLGAVGFAVGNWYPVFGNFLEKTMADPNSPARLQLGYEHAVAGAVVGLILGTVGARRR